MSRRVLTACNACGALEEVAPDRLPVGWLKIDEVNRNGIAIHADEWLACSARCLATLGAQLVEQWNEEPATAD